MLFASMVSLLGALICYWIGMVNAPGGLGGFFQLIGWILFCSFIVILWNTDIHRQA